MGCPFHDDGDHEETTDEQMGSNGNNRASNPANRDIDRRSFIQSALVIGGASAVSQLASATELAPTAGESTTERISAAHRFNRQHSWDAFEKTVPTGNTVQPASSLFLLLDYKHEGEPAAGHRRQVEDALRSLETKFEWGSEGLLFTIAYSASYFDRFDDDPPEGAAPWPADRVVDESSNITPYDPVPDTADALLLLASDNPANTLAAEAALWGEDGPDIPTLDATFEGVFEKPETWPHRRVGEGGPEFQKKELEYEDIGGDGTDIPDDAPLSMGFVAGFDESIPREEAVTLKQNQRFPGSNIDSEDVPTDLSYVEAVGGRDPGVFAQGTLKHLSYLTIDLDRWYSNDRDRRRHQMYSPYHGADETTDNKEKPGSGLVDSDGDAEPDRGDGPGTEELVARADADVTVDSDDIVYAERTPDTAAPVEGERENDGNPLDEPTTAHSQKAARARYDIDGDGEVEQPCLRRDWDGIRPPENGYEQRAGYHFNVPMRFNESIFTLLDANYGPQFRSLDGRIDQSDVNAADETTGDGERNGLVPFMEATRRNNWLVPPITVRALPHPKAERADITVKRSEENFEVTVSGYDRRGGTLDRDTVRFGTITEVNQAGGAEPIKVSRRGETIVFEFSREATELSGGDSAKLFAKKEASLKPVVGVES